MTNTESQTPTADGVGGANPVAAVGIHALSTALLLACAMQADLSLVACLVVAWGGGAAATVALLLALDAATQQGVLDADRRDASAPATAPDL